MNTLRHPAAGIVLFATLISLLLISYNGLKTGYDFEADNESLVNGSNIAESLNDLTLIRGINETQSAIYDLSTPTSSTFDILGSLSAAGIGVLKIIVGLVRVPDQILSVIVKYYNIPGPIVSAFVVLVVLYVGFILLSAYLRSRV
jgi:hypothetical protein